MQREQQLVIPEREHLVDGQKLSSLRAAGCAMQSQVHRSFDVSVEEIIDVLQVIRRGTGFTPWTTALAACGWTWSIHGRAPSKHSPCCHQPTRYAMTRSGAQQEAACDCMVLCMGATC
jgi:hypothetical protein